MYQQQGGPANPFGGGENPFGGDNEDDPFAVDPKDPFAD